jgi:hypothetical protein
MSQSLEPVSADQQAGDERALDEAVMRLSRSQSIASMALMRDDLVP